MIDNKNRFVINDYAKKSTFSNFLPGISGKKGIPLWSFYVNRGQCMSCFGVQDKDHSIMQFHPAHQAYQYTSKYGFRTFVKVNGRVVEAFLNENNKQTMAIGMNELTIEEINQEGSFTITVSYYTLAEEPVAGLIRSVTIQNNAIEDCEMEVMDGMPSLLPYGIKLENMNEMGQTSKAWMQVINQEKRVPIFKLRASMEDTAEVLEVSGGNFGFAIAEDGEKLPVFVNNENIFEFDTSLSVPHHFIKNSIKEIEMEEQLTQNEVPCCFFGKKKCLKQGERITIYEVYGQVENQILLETLLKKANSTEFFNNKYKKAVELTDTLTQKIATKTNNRVFDLYCRQTYLDNVLRGGEPTRIADNKVFYLYSRKHGDMERDYNYFKMLPEFYSQGNGNFRDVNQNRRCDTLFSPYVETENIKLFYNAIQIDGYNPLGIEKMTYYLEEKESDQYKELGELRKQSFTPGMLLKKLIEVGSEEKFEIIMSQAVGESKTDFIEGYWSDHWTYNLDLVENYLVVYPEEKNRLLFQEKEYTYLIGNEFVLPAKRRYQETEKGIRQYHFLEKNKNANVGQYLCDKEGNRIKSTLIEKMLLLSILKFCTLDVYGMGIEMEGGKPGWYDALNGLPGLLGSSMAETYEVARMMEYIILALEEQVVEIKMIEELDILLTKVLDIIVMHQEDLKKDKLLAYWKEINVAKESYREMVKERISGNTVSITAKELSEKISQLLFVLKMGIEKALKIGNGICPTYFYYEVSEFQKEKNDICILDVQLKKVPNFLEGPVRFLKRNIGINQKRELYQQIKKSELYDKKLQMYKVNESLEEASIELGRARAFTPGWLENESIWLHMEYKYLLELLKSELYEEFLEDFQKVVVPFLKEEIYGRSLLENSSFIASSANPNSKIHGKGFVARLSGSTVEFLNIWQIMMFGKSPFYLQRENLNICLQPLIPKYLIGEDKRIEAMFLGSTEVVYCLEDQEDFIPGNYKIEKYVITKDKKRMEKEILSTQLCNEIRKGMVSKIEVYLVR